MAIAFKYALFDFDGTVIDTFPGIADSIRYALKEELGVEENNTDRLRHFFGPPLDETLRIYYNCVGEDSLRVIKSYRAHYNARCADVSFPFPGVIEGLKRLREAGVKTAIASSKHIDAINSILRRSGMEEQFDQVFASASGLKVDKSKGDRIIDALEALGCTDKSTACMSGDRVIDSVGAEEAGVAFAAAMYGGSDITEFDGHKVDLFAQCFTDTVNWILGE